MATTCRRVEFATRQFLESHFDQGACYFIFLPSGAETMAYLPDPATQGTSRRRFRNGLHDDIWYQRYPPVPGKTIVVRHSDHTPASVLKDSQCYRRFLHPRNHHYGASICIWSEDLRLLGCITLLRPSAWGDFETQHLECMRSLHDHILQRVVRRLAEQQELRDSSHALIQAWRLAEEAAVVVNGDRILAATKQARRIIQSWNHADDSQKLSRESGLPEALRNLLRPGLTRSNAKKWEVEVMELACADRRKGKYHLLRFHNPAAVRSKWIRLTEAEKEIGRMVGAGHTNGEIAAARHRSRHTIKGQVSKLIGKLGVRNRVELAVQIQDLLFP